MRFYSYKQAAALCFAQTDELLQCDICLSGAIAVSVDGQMHWYVTLENACQQYVRY